MRSVIVSSAVVIPWDSIASSSRFRDHRSFTKISGVKEMRKKRRAVGCRVYAECIRCFLYRRLGMLNRNLFFVVMFIALTSCGSIKSKDEELSPQSVSTSTHNPTPLAQRGCQDGQIRNGFTSPTTSGDLPCPTGMQTCVSGQWHGPILYKDCNNYSKSCDGSPHGTVANGYVQPTTPKGVPCFQGTRTCMNGSWVGPMIYQTCSEFP